MEGFAWLGTMRGEERCVDWEGSIMLLFADGVGKKKGAT